MIQLGPWDRREIVFESVPEESGSKVFGVAGSSGAAAASEAVGLPLADTNVDAALGRLTDNWQHDHNRHTYNCQTTCNRHAQVLCHMK